MEWNNISRIFRKRVQPRELYPNFEKIAFDFPLFMEFPLNGSHFGNATIFEVSGNFSRKFRNFAVSKVPNFCSTGKRAAFQKLFQHIRLDYFWNPIIFFLLYILYQVDVLPPSHCHNTQLSWSVHLCRLCQRLS